MTATFEFFNLLSVFLSLTALLSIRLDKYYAQIKFCTDTCSKNMSFLRFYAIIWYAYLDSTLTTCKSRLTTRLDSTDDWDEACSTRLTTYRKCSTYDSTGVVLHPSYKYGSYMWKRFDMHTCWWTYIFCEL